MQPKLVQKGVNECAPKIHKLRDKWTMIDNPW
jgi:hypothetical protein